MDNSTFISNNAEKLAAFRKRQVFFVSSVRDGLPVQLESNTDSAVLALAERALNSGVWNEYSFPCVIDLSQLDALVSADTDDADFDRAVLLSRFSFMGTDGMRGKIAESSKKNPVYDFLGNNTLTPELIHIASFGFASMLASVRPETKGKKAILGNDGRDVVTGWALNEAMCKGFEDAGYAAEVLGVVPTPVVPQVMLEDGEPCGAALTASHNPSNQNGIKFFLDGKKILPEGQIGDYTLSAFMYGAYITNYVENNSPYTAAAKRSGAVIADVQKTAVEHMVSVLPADMKSLFDGKDFVLDTANGAFHGMAQALLDAYGSTYQCINAEPTGENINKQCGVAEVEGTHKFGGDADSHNLAVIRELLKKGRASKAVEYGIVLDGDGDRGFVLIYYPETDCVHVLDGDVSGYLLAVSKSADGEEGAFVVTVESDLMTSYSAGEFLGLTTDIVSVGDKWICNYDKNPLLVGLEASGHLIYPVLFKGKDGQQKELRAGNGMLTALMTLYSIFKTGIDAKQCIAPFEPGFTKTFYTYFVDKSLFYRDSAVWNKDKAILSEEVAKLTAANSDLSLEFIDKEDTHMLYAAIRKGSQQVGAVFCRNSGTEDKTAVYVQCRSDLAELMLPVGEAISALHIDRMKNPNRIEFMIEKTIVGIVEEKPTNAADLPKAVSKALGQDIAAGDVNGVLYGLKKEGRIEYDQDLVKLI